MPGDDVVLEVAGREMTVTSASKVMFDERGETKLDLVEYYLAIEGPLMRGGAGPARAHAAVPHGASGSSFFQKRVPDRRARLARDDHRQHAERHHSRALVAADLAHLVWAVNLGCLGFHVWPDRAADPEHTDELRLDLDPQPGVDFEEGARGGARGEDAARRARRHGLGRRRPATAASTCTSGSSPVGTPTRCAPRAVAVARELARRRPDVLTDAWWKEERGERVFIDFNQNAPHKTVFGAWSARARPGAQVSTPFRVGRARRDRRRTR